MATTKKKINKRTTATKAYDTEGGVIRLLRTKLTADDGVNSLTYAELRSAVKNYSTSVLTTCRPDDGWLFEAYRCFNFKRAPYYIGCHEFDLKNLNRILIAAGMRTTKKALAAGMGQ